MRKAYVVRSRVDGKSSFSMCPFCCFVNDDSSALIDHMNGEHVENAPAGFWWGLRHVGEIGSTDVYHIVQLAEEEEDQTPRRGDGE